MEDLHPEAKKVVYVENGIGYGGAIICLRHLVRNLDRARFVPMVVTGRTGPQYQEIADEARWQYIPDRHIDVVGAHRTVDGASWPDRLPGLRFLVNQFLGRLDDIGNFLPFFVRLWWNAWRFKADLIHANNEPLCNRAALMVGKALNIPTVCHVRGDQEGSRLMKWAFGLPDRLVPVSNWVSENIQRVLDVPKDRITVIYDGLELDSLDIHANGRLFREKYVIPDDAFAVGLVGLLIPWKGQDVFLDAARILKDQIPKLKMLVVGGTPDDCVPYEKRLKERVVAEGLQDIVIFTGHATDMPVVYNGLDVVVSASTSPEPLGTVVIESMALGRPLIGPGHGGAAEMMDHGKTGILFKPGDAQDLADSIMAFHDDPELRLRLGAAAREKALSTFAVAAHVEQVQAVYETLLKAPQGQKHEQLSRHSK